jgi:chromosomal replication initiator protein
LHDVLCLERSEREEWILIMKEAHLNWFLSEFNIRAWRYVKNYRPEKAANVTLIYGQKGLGKTALLCYLYQHGAQLGILTDAMAFARQYAYAAQVNKLDLFRQHYRTTKFLLIDDLQFLEGKIKTIEELYYTYEHVIGNKGKMVLTLESDSPQLEFLGERLASRFLSGVVIPIPIPFVTEIERFIGEYIHRKQLNMDTEVPKEIAKRTNNLANALMLITQFVKFAEQQQEELSLQCFQAYWEDKEKNLTAEPMNIIKIVAQTMEIPIEGLVGTSRKPGINEARELAIYIIRTLCQISYPKIARYFNRNHSSIMLSYKKMVKKLAEDHELEKKYKTILEVFQKTEPAS